MEEKNDYNFKPTEMASLELTPESFITLCRLIQKQEVKYDDAWSIVKDLVKANKWMDERPF